MSIFRHQRPVREVQTGGEDHLQEQSGPQEPESGVERELFHPRPEPQSVALRQGGLA